MGKGQSKDVLSEDGKFMEAAVPGSTAFLQSWTNGPYNFGGELSVPECQKLKERILMDIHKSKRRDRRGDPELRAACTWLSQAQKRRNKDTAGQRQGGLHTTIAAAIVKPHEETSGRPSRGGTNRDADSDVAAPRGAERGEDRQSVGNTTTPPTGAHSKLSPPAYEPPITRSHTQQRTKTEEPENKHINLHYPDLNTFQEDNKRATEEALRQNTQALEKFSFISPQKQQMGILETYPMIQVANPNHDPDIQGSHPTMYVFRPWTEQECSDACSGLGDPTQDPQAWIENHKLLMSSYMLNGWETEKTLKKTCRHQYSRVRGDFTGKGADGNWLPAGDITLETQLTHFYERVANTWKKTTNFVKIGQTCQKDDESVDEYFGRLEEIFKAHSGLAEEGDANSAYQQQLKTALLNGLQPYISEFIRNYNINHNTDGPIQIMNYARHAENTQKKAKKAKAAAAMSAFAAAMEDTVDDEDIFYQGYQDQQNWRGHSKQQWQNGGKGQFQHGHRNTDHTKTLGQCFSCGKRGHKARDCMSSDWIPPAESSQNQRRFDFRQEAPPPQNDNPYNPHYQQYQPQHIVTF